MRRKLHLLWPPAAFLLLSIVFCWPAGFAEDVLAPGDTSDQYFSYLQRAFQPVSPEIAGPWDPTHFTGLPESHCPIGCYYPFTQVLFRCFSISRAFGLALILHHVLAGLGAYLLIREFGLSRTAAWLAGIIFSFGGFMLLQRGHFQSQQVAAWLPLILWTFERYRRSGDWLWALSAGSLLAVQGLAAHMQTIVICGSVWVVYLVYFTLAGTGTACSRLRFALGVTTACFLGALGSLPQTLPMLEVAGWSPFRASRLQFVAEGNLKFRFLVGLLNPWLLVDWKTFDRPLGYWGLVEHGIFFGTMALAAACAGVLSLSWRRSAQQAEPTAGQGSSGPTRREAWFWLVLAFLNFLLILGENVGMHRLVQHIPIYNLFHVPARHSLVLGLALAWFAAVGVDSLCNLAGLWRSRLLKRVAVVMLALTATCALGSLFIPGWPHGPPGLGYAPLWIAVGSSVASVLALALLCARRPGLAWLAAGIPIVAAVELWGQFGSYALAKVPTAHLTDPERFPEAIRWLREHAEDGRPARYVMQRDVLKSLDRTMATYGSSWGLSSLDTYCNSASERMSRLLHVDGYGRANLPLLLAEEKGLSAAAGKYIVAKEINPIAPGMGHQVARLRQFGWKRDGHDCCPAGPFPLLGTNGSKVLWEAAVDDFDQGSDTFYLEGELTRHAPMTGSVRVRAAVLSSRTAQILSEQVFTPENFLDEKAAFQMVFRRDQAGWGRLRVQLVAENVPAIDLVQMNVWRLSPELAARGAEGVDEIGRLLHAHVADLYPVVARFADCNIYLNPQARDLATLVRDVRPAATHVQAAENIRHADRPAREVAYVTAPSEEPAEWSKPRRFAPGTARILNSAPNDIRIATDTKGTGFLVLAVTRCRGWSATVDGERVPILAVDGPLMGVKVPSREHEVRFHFRPVLHWLGTGIACLALGSAWTIFFAAPFVRRRSGRHTAPVAKPEPTSQRRAA